LAGADLAAVTSFAILRVLALFGFVPVLVVAVAQHHAGVCGGGGFEAIQYAGPASPASPSAVDGCDQVVHLGLV
jgi:hypothetical protein